MNKRKKLIGGIKVKDILNIKRNFEGIQFAELRKVIDPKYNEVHDELTDCYRNKKPFKNYSVLDKETFDKLHGLIFHIRDVEFHEENLKRPEETKYPESKYNEIRDKNGNIIAKKNELSLQKISQRAVEGLTLTIE